MSAVEAKEVEPSFKKKNLYASVEPPEVQPRFFAKPDIWALRHCAYAYELMPHRCILLSGLHYNEYSNHKII
jgi:hypothetical protein